MNVHYILEKKIYVNYFAFEAKRKKETQNVAT